VYAAGASPWPELAVMTAMAIVTKTARETHIQSRILSQVSSMLAGTPDAQGKGSMTHMTRG